MKTITINIPTPCTQNWDTMEERSIGRHCNSCSKTVVDFTSFTDEQLVGFLERSKTNVCGRIELGRLDTPIPSKAVTKRNRRHWLFPITAILALFGMHTANAQDTSLQDKAVYLHDSTETYPLKIATSTKRVKQFYIEIMVLGIDGKPLIDNFFIKVRSSKYPSLRYTLRNGLIVIPTDQFDNEDDLYLEISDYLYQETLCVSIFSLQRYEVVFESTKAKNLFDSDKISTTREFRVMGAFSVIKVINNPIKRFINMEIKGGGLNDHINEY